MEYHRSIHGQGIQLQKDVFKDLFLAFLLINQLLININSKEKRKLTFF